MTNKRKYSIESNKIDKWKDDLRETNLGIHRAKEVVYDARMRELLCSGRQGWWWSNKGLEIYIFFDRHVWLSYWLYQSSSCWHKNTTCDEMDASTKNQTSIQGNNTYIFWSQAEGSRFSPLPPSSCASVSAVSIPSPVTRQETEEDLSYSQPDDWMNEELWQTCSVAVWLIIHFNVLCKR